MDASEARNDMSDRRITDSYLRAIGMVARESALLEATLGIALSTLAGMDLTTGRVLVSRVNTSEQIKAIKLLVPLKIEEHQQEAWRELLSLIEELLKERNHIVHGSIFLRDDRATRYKLARSKLLVREHVSLEEIDDVGKTLGKAWQMLLDLTEKFNGGPL